MKTDIFQDYFKGTISEQNLERLLDWVEASPQNQTEMLRQRQLYDIILFSKKVPKNNIIKRIYPIVASIAAMVAILLLVFTSQNDAPLFQTITTPSGQRSQVTLADGSNVWLNANSTLTYSNEFGVDNRTVTIDGEGYFEVVKGEDLPFNVVMNNAIIHVTGTKFNAYSNSVLCKSEVVLIEGSVDIYKSMKNKKLIAKLSLGEKFTLIGNVSTKSTISTYSTTCWKDGIHSFENEPFLNVAAELEQYHGVKIVTKNIEMLRRKYTGKFNQSDGIQHILNVLKKADPFGYTFSARRDSIYID